MVNRYIKAFYKLLTPTSIVDIENKKIMKSVLGDFKGIVLDVGCGESNEYLGFCPGDRYIGVDMEKTNLTDAIGDAAFLPFKDESFDAVICNSVLEHVEKPKEVFKEIYRVAKPGGQCYIGVPFLINYHPVPEDFQRWTKVGFLKECEEVGFKEIKMYTIPGIMNLFEDTTRRAIAIHINNKVHKKGVNSFIYLILLHIISLIFHLLAKFYSSFGRYEEDFSVSYKFVGYKRRETEEYLSR